MKIKDLLKRNALVRKSYYHFLWLKNKVRSTAAIAKLKRDSPEDFALLAEMRTEVRSLFPTNLNLTNSVRYYIGKNILGYPTMSFLKKDGKNIGWEEGRLTIGDTSLPLMQMSIDKDINIPNLFKKYKPEIIVDFGTASGGTAVFFHQLAQTYAKPRILSIDISDADYKRSEQFHTRNHTSEKIDFVFGKSTLDCLDEVKNFLNQRKPGQRALLSFDDCHTYTHTLQELELFSPLLQKGDAILMQDTWNQDLFCHEVSPMFAVYKFLKKHHDFTLDKEFNTSLTLPCNFIYGLITKN